jgi:hypothetical protein
MRLQTRQSSVIKHSTLNLHESFGYSILSLGTAFSPTEILSNHGPKNLLSKGAVHLRFHWHHCGVDSVLLFTADRDWTGDNSPILEMIKPVTVC